MDRKIVLNVKGNSYTIEFPNVGRFQSVETAKQVISKGMYTSLLSTPTHSAIEVLDMIDMEACFSVLCPNLLKELKCKSFGDLDIADYKELKTVYIDQFLPWWNQILEMLRPQPNEE